MPESEGLTSDSDSLFPLLEQYVWWRGKPSPSRTWSKRWKTVTWTQHLFGRTLLNSTAKRGAESWIASLAATRASHSRLREDEPEQVIQDTCSHTLPASLQKCNLPWCSSRTLTLILPLDLKKSESDFKDWVIGLRREYSQRKKWGPRTAGSASSLWGTPANADAVGSNGGGQGKSLRTDVAQWPTATSTDAKASGAAGYSTKSGRHSGTTLTDAAVRQWPTPISRDVKSGAVSNETLMRNSRPLSEVAIYSLQAPPSEIDGQKSPKTCNPQLNPRFVEWLMGMPHGWTDCEHLETESFLSWQQLHSERLQEILDCYEARLP